MDRRDILFAVALAGLGLGGAAMTQVGASVFPGNEALIFWIGAAFVAASIVGLIVLFVFPTREVFANGPLPASSHKALAPRADRVSRDDNLTPAKLMAMCAGKTDIQCDYATADFVGTPLRVSGNIVAVSKFLDKASVTIALDENIEKTAFLLVSEGHARLLVMHEGEPLTADGHIMKISAREIQLKDCRLVL